MFDLLFLIFIAIATVGCLTYVIVTNTSYALSKFRARTPRTQDVEFELIYLRDVVLQEIEKLNQGKSFLTCQPKRVNKLLKHFHRIEDTLWTFGNITFAILAGIDVDTRCLTCTKTFKSRNRLFEDHLNLKAYESHRV